MPNAICFDAAGTLIYLPRPVGEHYREVAIRFGVDLDADALDKAFKKTWAAAPARESQEGPRADDDKEWWRALVEQVLARVLSPEQATEFNFGAFFEAVYTHFAHRGVWLAYPEVHEVLAHLKRNGYLLAIISNFDRRLHPVLADLGLTDFFETVVISSEVGADKPDPRIFMHALDRLGVQPGEVWHVGDDPKRDWGAEALGLRVFRLERPGHTLHDLLAALDPGTHG